MESGNGVLVSQNAENEIAENEIAENKIVNDECLEDKVERIMNWCSSRVDVNDVYDLLEVYEEEDVKRAITLRLRGRYQISTILENKDNLDNMWISHLEAEEIEKEIYEREMLRRERRRQWEEKERKKKETEEAERKKKLEEEEKQLRIQRNRENGELLDKAKPWMKLSDKKYAKLKKQYGNLTSDQIFYDTYELPKAIPVLLLFWVASFFISGIFGLTILVFSTVALIFVIRTHWRVSSYDDARRLRIMLGLEEKDEEPKN